MWRGTHPLFVCCYRRSEFSFFSAKEKGNSETKFPLIGCRNKERSLETADGVADDNTQHHRGDKRVEPIAVGQKINERKQHTHNGREDEYEHSELYPALCVEAAETTEDARKRGVLLLPTSLLVVEMCVIGHGVCAMTIKVEATADKGDDTGRRYPPAEGVADELLDVVFHKRESRWRVEEVKENHRLNVQSHP